MAPFTVRKTNSCEDGGKRNVHIYVWNSPQLRVLFCSSALVIQHTRVEYDGCQSVITVSVSNVPLSYLV